MLKRKPIIALLCIAIILISFSYPVQAEGLSTSIGVDMSKPVIGDELTIVISVNRALSIKNYDFLLTYDAALFQYVSGSANNLAPDKVLFGADKISDNQIQVTALLDPKSESSKLMSLKFKALNAGDGSFRASSINVSGDYPSPVSTTVTVTKPISKSSDITLKSLTICPGTLSPAF